MKKEMLITLVDKVVKVDRGGPESRIGKMLAVDEDCITLLTEDEGIVYYKTHHIKSLTANAKNELEYNVEIPEDFEYKKGANFKSVLEELKYHWIKINRGGPETLEGVLDDINEDYVTIVANEEVIRLSMFHIRNVSYGVKVEKPKPAEIANADESAKESGGKNQEKGNEQKKQKDAKGK
jgi:spore coat protein B